MTTAVTTAKKKTVSSSNLALRFYKCHGWTREVLEGYLVPSQRGGRGLVDSADRFGDDDASAYFILSMGSRLDIDQLYAEQVGEVLRAFNDNPFQTDLDFMRGKNW